MTTLIPTDVTQADIEVANAILCSPLMSQAVQLAARHRLAHQPGDGALREAATFLLWAYDHKQPISDAHEAWKALRAALTDTSPTEGEGTSAKSAHVRDAAEILEHYAAFIRTVKADDLELHPYLPQIEDVAASLRPRPDTVEVGS